MVQKGVGDKELNTLEKAVKSKLEEILKSTLEVLVIPAFEMLCKAIFEQVNSTFQKGIAYHTVFVQKQFEFVHSPLVFALRFHQFNIDNDTRH
uniref:Dynamin stalk domain-containing protein n=1 Tax=Solanum lycopersicum TaxID=4081 RepID=K4D7Q3_SOLLC